MQCSQHQKDRRSETITNKTKNKTNDVTDGLRSKWVRHLLGSKKEK